MKWGSAPKQQAERFLYLLAAALEKRVACSE